MSRAGAPELIGTPSRRFTTDSETVRLRAEADELLAELDRLGDSVSVNGRRGRGVVLDQLAATMRQLARRPR